MATVRVTFDMEPSDPNDRTGLTIEEYDKVTQVIIELGGDNPEIELIEEDT